MSSANQLHRDHGLVRNHNDRSTEVLLTDVSNQLYLVSKDQKVLWNMSLPSAIQGDVHQIDLLKNGKLQYLFITAGQLHVVDRLGRYVTGYPKPISMTDAVSTSLVDYDKSRNYRLLMANAAGRIAVCDMEGKPLEGWTSKNLRADSPIHRCTSGSVNAIITKPLPCRATCSSSIAGAISSMDFLVHSI